MYDNEKTEGLPTKKQEIVDISIFDLRKVDDIDVQSLKSFISDKNAYSVLHDQVAPAIYRRLSFSPIADISRKLKEIHNEFEPMIESFEYSSKVMFREVLSDDLSIERVRKESRNHKDSESEDYFVFDVFAESKDIDKKFSNMQKTQSKYAEFARVMTTYDDRRFKYNAVEDEAKSFEIAYFEEFYKILEKVSILRLVGLSECDALFNKILGKRQKSNATQIMLWGVRDLGKRTHSAFYDYEILKAKDEK